jgi:hypothetical protein
MIILISIMYHMIWLCYPFQLGVHREDNGITFVHFKHVIVNIDL